MITSRASWRTKATLVLFFADLSCALGALLAASTLRFGWSEGLAFAADDAHRLAALAVLVPVVASLCGVYGNSGLGAGVVPTKIVISTILGALLAGGCLFATSPFEDAQFLTAGFAAVLVPGLLLMRILYGRVLAAGRLSPRAVVVGTAEQISSVLGLIRRHPEASPRVRGIVLSRRPQERVNGLLSEFPVLGGLDSLEAIVEDARVDMVLLGASPHRDPELARRARALRFRGVAILDFVSLHERLAREVPLDEVDDIWLTTAAMASSRHYIHWLKRTLDVIGALLLVIPAALLTFPAALAIRLTSPGPVLFRQERLGLGGRVFELLKLRTMRVDAEKLTGPTWSTDNDPRITRIGRILRMFRLDELPQIINVLRGDMSLVGPRPERPTLARQITEQVPLFPERLLVRPGITGWAQVMAPYASSIADSHRKLQFDLYYAKNLSLSLDLRIFAKTVSTMLFGREREQGGLVAGKQLEPAVSNVHLPGAVPDLSVADAQETSGSIPMSRAG